jgi:hypothetical protein
MSHHDARPSAAAETPRASALVFEAMPEDGRIGAHVAAPPAAVRLHFVPLGGAAADPAPAPIRVQKTGWSVREQSPGRHIRAAVDPLAVPLRDETAAVPAATLRRSTLIPIVAVVIVLLVLALGSTALLRHLT